MTLKHIRLKGTLLIYSSILGGWSLLHEQHVITPMIRTAFIVSIIAAYLIIMIGLLRYPDHADTMKKERHAAVVLVCIFLVLIVNIVTVGTISLAWSFVLLGLCDAWLLVALLFFIY